MDERLRRLSRDAAQGDNEAKAKLLKERVRIGETTQERLTLAALLGNEAARRSLADEIPAEPAEIFTGQWFESLGDIAVESATRSTLAYSREALLRFGNFVRRDYGNDELANELIDHGSQLHAAYEAWIVDPSDQNREQAQSLWDRFTELTRDEQHFLEDEQLYIAIRTVWSNFEKLFTMMYFPNKNLQTAGDGMVVMEQTDAQQLRMSQQEFQEVIRGELLPWALGEGDPVADRVSARQQEEQAQAGE